MYFSYEHLQLRYEPFPIGIARPLMDETMYREMLDNYPDIALFESHAEYGKAGIKYALTEKLNPKKYYQFIKSTPVWRDFHRWVTRGGFVRETVMALKEQGVDLGYDFPDRFESLKRRLKSIRNGQICPSQPPLRARFEFSALPANGGKVVPHTDATRKLITLVVSMVREGEWNSAFGGGTDANRPKNPRLNYNFGNSHAKFEDMEVIDTFEFQPNQAVVFVKTFNSWHSVRPMSGTDSEALRKTLTINIMRKY